jgi:hypothetical protein
MMLSSAHRLCCSGRGPHRTPAPAPSLPMSDSLRPFPRVQGLPGRLPAYGDCTGRTPCTLPRADTCTSTASRERATGGSAHEKKPKCPAARGARLWRTALYERGRPYHERVEPFRGLVLHRCDRVLAITRVGRVSARAVATLAPTAPHLLVLHSAALPFLKPLDSVMTAA